MGKIISAAAPVLRDPRFDHNLIGQHQICRIGISVGPLGRIKKMNKIFIPTILLSLLVFYLPIYAQHNVRVASVNDSTNSIELSPFKLHITFPKPENRLPRVGVAYFDGIVSYSLGSYKGDYLRVSISTPSGIQSSLDSMNARQSRGEYGSGDEPPLETIEEYNHYKSIFQNHMIHDYFDNYSIANNRWYGTRAYSTEMAGYVSEGYTFIDSLQIIFSVTNNIDSLSKEVNSFLFHLELYPIYARELSEQIILDVCRTKLPELLNRIKVEKE